MRREEGVELEEYFMHIKGPEILNMWLGETERMVREVFAQARKKRKEGYLPFVFIDEAESILGTRRSMRSHNISNTVVPMFCTEMDGIESLHDVVIILASNRHDLIDPAILRPGRIDRKIKVNRPDYEAAKSIFSIYLTPSLPVDAAEVAEHGTEEAARAALVEQGVDELFARTEETRFLEVSLRSGRQEVLYRAISAAGLLSRRSCSGPRNWLSNAPLSIVIREPVFAPSTCVKRCVRNTEKMRYFPHLTAWKTGLSFSTMSRKMW